MAEIRQARQKEELILTIRTDRPEAEIGLYKDGTAFETYHWQAHRELSRTLLQEINELLGRHQVLFEDISGIIVFHGPGSFTGLRIGISIANALAYGLNIPVVGVGGERWIEEGLRELSSARPEQYPTPFYGAEAHITRPKK